MEVNKNRGKTRTRSFGSSGRFSHDSEEFYKKKIYSNLTLSDEKKEFIENKISKDKVNKIFCKTSEKMSELPDCSVHLMVTSPPYNVGKDYDDNLTLGEYFALLERIFKETYRVLVPGGRVAINIANVGRKPYLSLNSEIIKIMIKLGFMMRGEIIWEKGASAGGSCAWGSWKSASNPTLRDTHEYIMIFSKDKFKRDNPDKRHNTISRDDFLALTKSVWTFQTESAKKVKHPAPFPVELPRRIIELYTFADEVVLDPFMGVGTTAIAAIKTGRRYVGYDIGPEYCELANQRINRFIEEQKVDRGQRKPADKN